MNKLEVAMYVRYKRGSIGYNIEPVDKIGKIINQVNNSDIYELDNSNNIFEDDVVKASHNIIDLIEVGDYVNGRKVYQVGYNFQDDFVLKMSESNYDDFIYPNEVAYIVTKEQFESMKYIVNKVD